MSNQLNKTGYSDIYRDKEKKKIAKAESRNDSVRKAIKDEARGVGTKKATKKAINKRNRSEKRLGFKKGEVRNALFAQIERSLKNPRTRLIAKGK